MGGIAGRDNQRIAEQARSDNLLSIEMDDT